MKIKLKLLFIFILIIMFETVSFASFDINSQSGILVETSTGKIIFEKDAYNKMYPASTTKILTAILVLENCNLDDIATVSETALSNIPSGYVTCNLQVGEKISIKDLLYALLLPSANDAAYVLAEHVGRSIQDFSDMMNKKATEIGCTSSHFVNPNGIHDNSHYSTAYDLYLIANYAMKNETFKEIVKTTEYTLPATNKYHANDRILKTTNELLKQTNKNYYENAIGIKTGHTSQAGDCLVSGSIKNDMNLISVTLNGTRFADAKELFEYGFNNYTFSTLLNKNTVVKSIEVSNGSKKTKNLDLVTESQIYTLHNINLDINNIAPNSVTLNENILAPIQKGDILGIAHYTIEDKTYDINLIANSDVEKNIDIYIILISIGGFLLIISMLLPKKKHKKIRK